MTISRFKVLIVTILSVLILNACSVFKPYSLKKEILDPAFTKSEILATGLVLGGVISRNGNLDEENRKDYVSQLEFVLTERSIYGINTAIKLSQRLKRKKYLQLLNNVKSYGNISVEGLVELREILHPARYLLFVIIERDEIKKDIKNYPTATKYIVTRDTKTELIVMNLKTSKHAVKAEISVSKSNKNRVKKNRNKDNSESTINHVINKLVLAGYPEPPTLQDNLKTVFLGVADLIPRK